MNRRGVTLVAALLALLIASAFASAALAAAHYRWRAGLGQGAATRVTLRVRAALEQHLATWDQRHADSLAIGSSEELDRKSEPGLRGIDSVTRLGSWLYQLHSTSEELSADGVMLARDGGSLLLALEPPQLHDSAAVLSPGPVATDPGSWIHGEDQDPPGWVGCPPAESTGVAQLIDPVPLRQLTPGFVTLLRPTSGDTFSGTVLAPGPAIAVDSTCQPTAMNWGDPQAGPCAGLNPVVVLQPGTRVVDGKGAGVLISLGSVELSGDFLFTGVMVALGSVRMSDRARLIGALVATGPVELTGMAEISRSSCAVRRALGSQHLVPVAIPGGWWRSP